MKATGVVRRIDDLGRVVIPKEIRKTLRLKNGENLEIFVDENENIILKKYSQIDKLKEFAGQITEAINSITKKSVFIINTDSFVSTSGKKKGYLNEPISNELIAMINNRKEVQNQNQIQMTEGKQEEENISFCPIIVNGDAIGAIMIMSEEEITENEFQTLKIISSFLSKHIEQ